MSSLFIGLGGVGSGTLDHLYEKMDSYNQDMVRRGNPAVNAYYYYVDTESARFDQSPDEFMGEFKKFHLIGKSSPDSIKNAMRRDNGSIEARERYDLLQKWYEAPAKTTNMMAGADTIRQYSRLAFMEESFNIHRELTQIITNVTASQGRIYVITGSCGGTGCGIYMDILYMISEIYENANTPTASTDARLIMAMPEGYVADGNQMDVQYQKKKLNAFATLTELNAVCKDKNSQPSLFNNCYVGPNKKNGVFQPFRFGYFFDSAGFKSRDEVSQKLADFLFELELAGDPTNSASTQQGYNGSYFDGLLTGTVDGNWNASIAQEYVKAFNALGQYSIEKPDYLYRKYFSDRLLYDVFHEGLIGKIGSVDTGIVSRVTENFQGKCDQEVTKIYNYIIANIISKDDFVSISKSNNTFSVFTSSPNDEEPTVKSIIEKKKVLFERIKNLVYGQCKQWLEEYDFTTVYSILEALDLDAYRAATNSYGEFDDQLEKAKKASISTSIMGKESIKPEKALEQFNQLLNTWLTFEMNKALSSGIDVDITTQNQGYYDYCKSFVETAKRGFALEKEQEHWDEAFKKEVTDLKEKKDRSYIPDLNTIVDAKGDIVLNSDMVVKYENDVKMSDVSRADFTQGTCTPITLHAKIIGEMKTNVSLKQEGIDMDVLFDPTPGKTNTLNNVSKAALFVEKYVATAKEQINILLSANESYGSLFAGDILTRLQTLPKEERTKKCLDFAKYDNVQLKTEDMAQGTVTQYTYYLLGTGANTELMTSLGIQRGNNSDYKDDSFFAEKIVKLIVKNGYKIDDYRYFGGYRDNAVTKMSEPLMHDPFIDKRFKGEKDVDGKYPCDVSDVLSQINTDTQAAQQAQQYSVDGCKDVQVYQYCLALLFKYFDTLKAGGNIDTSLVDGITTSGNTLTVKDFTFDVLYDEYVLASPITIDLPSLSNINNMVNLSNWIDYVMKKKDQINNERTLYQEAAKFLKAVGVTIDPVFNTKIVAMMGTGNRPVYDFFNAYLDWYNKD